MAPERHWLEQRFKDLFPNQLSEPQNASRTDREPRAIPENLDRYVAAALRGVINDLHKATEGERNDKLNIAAYRLGRFVSGAGLDENIARAWLEDTARAIGLEPGEIGKTIQSGLGDGKADPFTLNGNDYRVPELQGVIDTPETAVELPQPADWAVILGDKTPDVEWLIPGIIERGRLHALFAPSKTHKSLIVQYFSAQLAQESTVMYLDLENSRADLRTRFLDMGHTPESLANLLYFPFPALPALDTHAGGAQLVAMAEHFKPELVIIDTTSRVIKGGENDSDTFRALYRHAMVHLKAMGIAVLRIDHAGKDVALGQRGSSAKSDDVDTVWLLIKQDEDRFTLKCTHQRSGNHPDIINLQKVTEPTLRFDRLGESESNRPLDIDAIIAELDKLGAPNGMGRQAAEKLLRSAGKNVRQRMVQDAVDIRKLRLDAKSLSDLSGSKPGSRDFRQDRELLDQSLDHSQCKQPKMPDEALDHSLDPGEPTVIQGVPGGGWITTGGAICPPVIQPSDTDPLTDLAIDLFTGNGIRVSLADDEHKGDGIKCFDCGQLGATWLGGKFLCRQCAYKEVKRYGL